MKAALRAISFWTRRSWITLAVLGLALLSVQSVLAADNGQPTDYGQTVLGVIGGVIASTIISLVNQRHNLRRDTKVENTAKKVDTLARELGVDDPQKVAPDLNKMERQIAELQADLITVKNELVTTLQERDTAREQAAQQVEKNARDNLNAQQQIDRLSGDLEGERDTSARLEQQLRDYDQRFRQQELDIAHIRGRLDQQSVQDQLGSTMQTVAKLLNDVALRIVPVTTAEATPT